MSQTINSDPQTDETLAEKPLLMTTFQPLALIYTYKGGQRLEVRDVKKYEIIANGRLLNKTDVLFAINAERLEAVKTGITFDNDVKKRNLRTAIKPKDRPNVLTKAKLDEARNRDVRIVMRSGHVLRGVMLIHSRYNLVLKINQALVLVYRHGVLEFAITPQQKPQPHRD